MAKRKMAERKKTSSFHAMPSSRVMFKALQDILPYAARHMRHTLGPCVPLVTAWCHRSSTPSIPEAIPVAGRCSAPFRAASTAAARSGTRCHGCKMCLSPSASTHKLVWMSWPFSGSTQDLMNKGTRHIVCTLAPFDSTGMKDLWRTA